MRSGVRCAETMRVSWVTPRASSICAAACMGAQSESRPMMMATAGLVAELEGDLLRFAMGCGGLSTKRRSIGTRNPKESAISDLVNHLLGKINEILNGT